MRHFTSAATDLLVLDDLGDEVARAQVIRNGHPYSQDAYVRETCEQLQRDRRRDTDVFKFTFSDDGRRATVAYMTIGSIAFALSASDAAAHCGPLKKIIPGFANRMYYLLCSQVTTIPEFISASSTHRKHAPIARILGKTSTPV